jgi:hypothetical protein
MPLVKIFAKHTLQKPIPLAALQSKLCDIWGTKPDTTKLMLQRVDDWTDDSFAEDVYGELIDVERALFFYLVGRVHI